MWGRIVDCLVGVTPKYVGRCSFALNNINMALEKYEFPAYVELLTLESPCVHCHWVTYKEAVWYSSV
jgi:hypothetical protein